MILLDANVLMYAAGGDHPNKSPSLHLLERIARGEVMAGADVEVLQEILHRYRANGRWSDGRRVYDLARQIVPHWLPVTLAALDEARRLLDADPSLSARDALHAGVCIEVDAAAFCSFDTDFSRIPGIRRVEPADVR